MTYRGLCAISRLVLIRLKKCNYPKAFVSDFDHWVCIKRTAWGFSCSDGECMYIASCPEVSMGAYVEKYTQVRNVIANYRGVRYSFFPSPAF